MRTTRPSDCDLASATKPYAEFSWTLRGLLEIFTKRSRPSVTFVKTGSL
jgi:hypothetical protein